MVLGYPINSSSKPGKLERKENCRVRKGGSSRKASLARSIRSNARLVDSEWSASDKPEVGRGLTTRARQSRTSLVYEPKVPRIACFWRSLTH
ncbi:hypothetical protein M5K25_028206 [Dendrobium thyrsiflorum]|uniref:Uncharacterized protein n=1 Tax=Dendrobium thyrsiflorum TaxID=117978 RepID=A0ABD0TTU0_DENTH